MPTLPLATPASIGTLAFNPKTDIESLVKPINWCADSLDRIREFPDVARGKVGQQLNRLQHGYEPLDWKPMQGIGPGVCEIRVHQRGEHRVFYVAKFAEAVYVLHAFAKKSRKTSSRDLAIAVTRFRALVETRKRLYP
jgi:phage-related protein